MHPPARVGCREERPGAAGGPAVEELGIALWRLRGRRRLPRTGRRAAPARVRPGHRAGPRWRRRDAAPDRAGASGLRAARLPAHRPATGPHRPGSHRPRHPGRRGGPAVRFRAATGAPPAGAGAVISCRAKCGGGTLRVAHPWLPVAHRDSSEVRMTTLVIGARGSIGRHVLDRLIAENEPVRASARNPVQAGLPAGVPAVAADLTRSDSLRAALDGVRRVFLYAPAGDPGPFIEAARDAGLERVVLLSSGSVLQPYARGNASAEEHRAVEEAFAASGLPWTPVRPLVLAGNALNWAGSDRAVGLVCFVCPVVVFVSVF